MHLRDHPTTFRREDYIAEVAAKLRHMGRDADLSYFNIVTFVEEVLLRSRFRKEPLRIEFYDAPEGSDDLAYVTFHPLTLHVDRETWKLARDGEPKARFIIAHEIGHIVLHEHDVLNFSNDPSLQINYRSKEHSVEWQANIFASHFLIPDRIVAAFDSAADLSTATAVTEPFVLARYPVEKRGLFKRVEVDGAICATCGNFTKMSDGVCRSDQCAASQQA